MNERAQSLIEAARGEGVFKSSEFTLYHTWIDGQPITFCGNMWRDPIQRAHRNGTFYEQEELSLLAQLVPPGATIVDIGANIGNHALYFAKFLGAAKVIPVEPNPVAYRLLMANTLLNRVGDVVDLTRLGVGLSNRNIGGFAVEERERNIGGTRMLEDGGDLWVYRGDTLFAGETPSVIKIDVEGMEIDVLAGLEATIATHRPLLLVEVDGRMLMPFAIGVVTTGTQRSRNGNATAATATTC